jgi:enoyl-CoA hydratase
MRIPVEYKTLLLEEKDAIATLSLNQADKRNAMSAEMGEEFLQVIHGLRTRQDLRVLVLTGAGSAFCAGGSLDMMRIKSDAPREENKAAMRFFYERFLALRDVSFPTIASINGYAIGAGLCIALACDMRIAADDAMMGMNFARLGLHPGMGATFMLPRLVGAARACELFFTGDLISGAEAERVGLVNRAVPPERLVEETRRLAERIASSAPGPVRAVKRAVYQGITSSLEDVLDYESSRQAECFETEDFLEGVGAAIQKREPRFKGK